jgi:outer membrane receptor protein involved in Fe transport
LTANVLGLFQTQASNVQVTQAIPGSAGAVNSVAVNQAKGEITGFEAEINAVPTSSKLSLRGAYSFTDASFTERLR